MHLKYLLCLGFLCLIYGCAQELGPYYFDFDAIDYYTTSFPEEGKDVEEHLSKGGIDLREQVVFQSIPKSIHDSLFVNSLEKIGFQKTTISDAETRNQIKELFREKSHRNPSFTACMPIFRDLLIFRKAGEIIGMAKICFDCGQSVIYGTTSDYTNFGQSGDYGRLWKILYE